jgi:endogenous inhibitor of DNA gyrase (YacG/DUF329 family)
VVECQLPKLDVAGSTPVTRSTSTKSVKSPPRRLQCPQCGSQFDRSVSRYAPFCSQRCKLIDLGKWLDEKYRIPGEPSESPGELGTDEDP